MKKILAGMFLFVAGLGGDIYGNEWGPYVYQAPIVSQVVTVVPQVPVIQYYVPVVAMVPLVPQYIHVTSSQNVLVERRYYCFLKRYEVLAVPQTVYVPNRY